jgi:quercetin dioxygenase-like cupin family protein
VVEVVRHGQQSVLVDPQTGVERRLLVPAFVRRGIEILRYTIPAAGVTGAFPPHRSGVHEHVTVVTGSVVCCLGQESIRLEAGDSVSFPANVVHSFRNPRDETCEYFLVIDSSRVDTASTKTNG